MSDKKTKQSNASTLQREWQFYAPPKYDHLLRCFQTANEMGKSEAINFIVRDFFNRMSKADIERITGMPGVPKKDG